MEAFRQLQIMQILNLMYCWFVLNFHIKQNTSHITFKGGFKDLKTFKSTFDDPEQTTINIMNVLFI